MTLHDATSTSLPTAPPAPFQLDQPTAERLTGGNWVGNHPEVTLHGKFALEDVDGDLKVEQMSTELLWGTWESASADTEADFLSGTATATRADVVAAMTP